MESSAWTLSPTQRAAWMEQGCPLCPATAPSGVPKGSTGTPAIIPTGIRVARPGMCRGTTMIQR